MDSKVDEASLENSTSKNNKFVSDSTLGAMLLAAQSVSNSTDDWTSLDRSGRVEILVRCSFKEKIVSRCGAARSAFQNRRPEGVLLAIFVAMVSLFKAETYKPDCVLLKGAIITNLNSHAAYLAMVDPRAVESTVEELWKLRRRTDRLEWLKQMWLAGDESVRQLDTLALLDLILLESDDVCLPQDCEDEWLRIANA